jgi:hypothetical protein
MLTLKCSFAQTVYTIPGATLQPQWVFPIWFEDGDGKRDTLLYGLDTLANSDNNFFNVSDTIFGERYTLRDTNKLCFAAGGNITIDSSDSSKYKLIRYNTLNYSTTFEYHPLFGWYFFALNVKLPLKIIFDVNTFTGANTPFAISSSPLANNQKKGQMLVGCTNLGPLEHYYSNVLSCSMWDAILVTDMPYNFQYSWGCTTNDTLIIDRRNSLTSPKTNISMGFTFENWLGVPYGTDIIEKDINQGFTVSNVNDKIVIKTTLKGNKVFNLFSLFGELKIKQNFNSEEIEISSANLATGCYIVRINNEKNTFSKKLII